MDRFELTAGLGVSAAPVSAERVTAFLRSVYGWMFVGLGITAAVALSVAGSPALLQTIVTTPMLLRPRSSPSWRSFSSFGPRAEARAGDGFGALRRLLGVERRDAVLHFPGLSGASIASTFVVTAGMFGALALYGSTTRRASRGLGHFVGMGLIGLFLAMAVGFFWHSSGLQFVISVVGVIVFTGFTPGTPEAQGDGGLAPGRRDRLLRGRRRRSLCTSTSSTSPLPAALPGRPRGTNVACPRRRGPALRRTGSRLGRMRPRPRAWSRARGLRSRGARLLLRLLQETSRAATGALLRRSAPDHWKSAHPASAVARGSATSSAALSVSPGCGRCWLRRRTGGCRGRRSVRRAREGPRAGRARRSGRLPGRGSCRPGGWSRDGGR